MFAISNLNFLTDVQKLLHNVKACCMILQVEILLLSLVGKSVTGLNRSLATLRICNHQPVLQWF